MMWRALALLPVAALLGACSHGTSPVGNGVGPTSIVVTATAGTQTEADGVSRVFQCLLSGVTARLEFSDGSSGDFTTRVKWTSSDPGVVQVSNGELIAGDNVVYTAGTLVPITAGSATITAEYSGLSQQLRVSVGMPTNFQISRIDQGIATPVSAASLGTGTQQGFRATAAEDGVEMDVTSFATWQVGSTIGTVTSSGVVTALGAGGPTALTTSFQNCGITAKVDLSVSNVASIAIVPEFGNDPLVQLNSEKMNVVATLDDGMLQDISLQSTLSSANFAVAAFSSATGATNVLVPVSAGSVAVDATFNNSLTATEQTINIVSATLTGITISPASTTIRASSNNVAYFKAAGTFDNGQTQEVTRAVSWAVLDTTLAGIGNTLSTAGNAIPGTLVGQTTVTATGPAASSTAPVATATLNVDSAAHPVP